MTAGMLTAIAGTHTDANLGHHELKSVVLISDTTINIIIVVIMLLSILSLLMSLYRQLLGLFLSLEVTVIMHRCHNLAAKMSWYDMLLAVSTNTNTMCHATC